MSTPVPANPNPFTDPNNALRQFNQYFGNLRKQYGEDAIRQVGFTTKEFQDLQASLRKLQVDPRATPEQHREAYMKARDTLARRLTTPLEATRSYSVVQQPKPAPSSSVGNDGIVTPMPVESPVMNLPTQEQLYSYARAVGRGETGLWDPTRGVFVMTAQPPQPQQGGLTQAQQPVMPTPPPMPQPPEREVIGQRSPIPGVHGGDTRIFAPTTQPQEIVVTGQRMPEPPRMPEIAAPPPPPSIMPPPPIRTYYDPEGPVAPQPPMPQPPMPVMPPPPVVYDTFRPTTPPPMPVSQPQELPVAPTQPDMPERHSEYGIPLWMQLRPGPERDAAYAQFMKGQGGGMKPKGIGGMLQPDSGYGSQQPMISDMAYRGPYKKPRMLSPNDFSIARGPIPLDQQGPPLGGGIGAILGSLKTASQGVGGMPMQPKGLTLSNVPRQFTQEEILGITSMPQRPQGVGMAPQMPMKPQGLTLSNVPQQQRLTLRNPPMQGNAPQYIGLANQSFQLGDPNFRFGQTPQVKAPNAQGMAMGGLMEKYYGGGMC